MPDLGNAALVLPLVLLAAALHACWNALVKSGADGDRLPLQAVIMFAPSLVAAPLLTVLPFPASAWPYLVVSILVHLAYSGLLVAAYRHGDLSQVYPIARGSAPLLVALGGWTIAGESSSPMGLLAIFILSAGIIALSFSHRPRSFGEARSILLALLVGLSIASYSLADGLGGRAAASVSGYIAWLFFLDGTLFLLIVAWLRRRSLVASFRPVLLRGLGGGLMSGLAYAIVIWAMSILPLAHVVALRETSVLIAAAIGAVFLKEAFGQRRIAASAIVVIGAVLLQFAR